MLASCATQKRATPTVCSVGDAPPSLLVIDEKAQQILRLAPTGDWSQIEAYIADIDDAWTNYAGTTVIKPEPGTSTASLDEPVGEAIRVLKEAAANRDASATTKSAGDLDAAAIKLYEYHHAAVSPNLRRLEVLERQILIDLSSDAYASALRTLDCAQEVWHRVQPRIQIQAGYQAAVAMDGQFPVQRTALQVKDRATVTASVQTMLSLIDQIQHLY
jgi:hypothetical protein